MYTRTITFRSDTEIDYILKQIQKYDRDIAKYNTSESTIIRSAILWYWDQHKKDNEYYKSDSSLNNSLTNT